MHLLVGIGNPGKEYEHTRHNVGFMAVDAIARRYGFGAARQKFHGELADGRIGPDKALALKPMTYVNKSGISVSETCTFYKLKAEHVIVFHDDLALVPGKIKVKKGGGHAGHNGLRDTDRHIGPDYWRVRIGVGHPGDKDRVTGHVLGRFSKADEAWLRPVLDALADELPVMLGGDFESYMSRIAHIAPPPASAPANN